jgi:hypothetical protein
MALKRERLLNDQHPRGRVSGVLDASVHITRSRQVRQLCQLQDTNIIIGVKMLSVRLFWKLLVLKLIPGKMICTMKRYV